jgi:two-component system phosphate regulon sensor histidine kinase PhoR
VFRSLRFRLVFTFFVLLVVVGAGTLFAIERTLADDLLSALDTRMTGQGTAVANWIASSGHPERLAVRLADVTGTRITIVGADGLVQGDSEEGDTVGRPVGDAVEIADARRGMVGKTIRRLLPEAPLQYVVAVPINDDREGPLRVVRLSVPLDSVLETRAKMRNRLLVGGLFGFLGCLVLSYVFIRAVTRPLQSMTIIAEKLADGRYDDVPALRDPGGELGVLVRAMSRMQTEVRQRFAEIREQRDLLSTVIGGLVEGVVVIDHGGAIVLVNDAAKPLVGGGAAGDQAHMPSELKPLVARALGGDPADEEVELVGRTIRASTRPLADHGAIAVLYDVTRLRALEAVRREFLSNAAHELRTPITSISGYAETLLSAPVDAETGKEFVEIIHRNAGRIASLVDDLLVLDNLGGRAAVVGERGPVPLAPVARDAAMSTKGVTPSAHIDVDVPADVVVLATRDGLDHVVQNLIDNAVKYGAGTPVKVTAKAAGKRVQLAIEDAGPGIPVGMEERIFERFYRLDAGRSRDIGGSGLGLAIVKSQVEAMGGRVFVENAKPGARFVVELDAS